MTNELTLPLPVANFVRAINDQDADRFLSTFTNDAVVTDVAREFRGAAAIKEWSDREIFDVNVTVDVLDVADRDGQTVIIAKVDGAFDRTGLPDPVLLEQRFTLNGGKIAAFSSQLASGQS
jgi:hypothetical protein